MDVTLRPIEEKDLALRIKWYKDPLVTKYLGSTVRYATDMEKLQKDWMEDYLKNDKKDYFVILCDDQPVGLIGLNDIDPHDKNAGLFITIGEKDYWGKGIAGKALELLKQYAFDKLNLHKIYLSVYSPNEGAIHLYEKCGYVHEGRLKEHVLIDGKWCDEVTMALFNEK